MLKSSCVNTADELCSRRFPEKSAAFLNASHERRGFARSTGGFHRKKRPPVTSGSPLPCHVIPNFPPLCSSLCCWRVQWKMPESVEQTPLFGPFERRALEVLSGRTGPLCWGYSWPGVDGPTVSLSGALAALPVIYIKAGGVCIWVNLPFFL